MKKGIIFALLLPALLAGGCSALKGHGKIEKDVILPSDRETLHKTTVQPTYTPEDLAKGLIKGDWTIQEVEGREAIGEAIPFIRFEPSEKRFYGNDGCNVINGFYEATPADSTIRFGGVMATMKACAGEGITSVEVHQALEEARRYTWELDGHDYRLTLLSEEDVPVMQLVHCNFEFLSGAWHVVAIDGEKVDVKGMDLVIDVDEGKIHGNTGCNILNGKLETDLETPNSISFSSIGTTRMMCPDIESETRLIVALEEACSAKALSADRVLLLGSNRQPVVELVRTDFSD